MNKVWSLLWAVAVCFSTGAWAQEVNYTPYEKFDARNDDFSVVGRTGDRLYTYHTFEKEHYLDAYNDNMDKVATVVLDFFPAKIYETRFIATPRQIIVLYQAISGNAVIQYAAALDERGLLKNKPVKLGEVKTGLLGPTKDYFSSAVSEDKKKVLIYSLKVKGDNVSLTGKLIDEDLKIERNVTLSAQGGNNVGHGEVLLANNGNIYLPIFTPIGQRNYTDELALLCAEDDTATHTVKSVKKLLPLRDRYASRVYIKIDNVNGRVYLGGFYSEKKNGNFDGVLYAYYNMGDREWQSQRMIPFDAQIAGATGERNTARAFNDFNIKQLIIKNDGGFVMVSEESYVTNRSTFSPGFGYYSWYYPSMGQNIREYYFNDILALSYNWEGQRDWFSFVRKQQYSQEDGGRFSSYAFLNSGATLGFLFNDYDVKNSRIQLATVDESGKSDMRSFTAEGNDNPDWLPRYGKQVSAREIVVPCFRKKQICFAKVVF